NRSKVPTLRYKGVGKEHRSVLAYAIIKSNKARGVLHPAPSGSTRNRQGDSSEYRREHEAILKGGRKMSISIAISRQPTSVFIIMSADVMRDHAISIVNPSALRHAYVDLEELIDGW
ncbi:9934_t:CDS:2, partial [Paraglomus brasilianum]